MTKCNIILLFVMGTKIRSVIRTAPTDLTLFSLLHVFTQVVPAMAWWVTRKTGKKNVGCCKGGFRMSAFARGRDAGHPRAWARGCSQTSGEHTSLGTHLSSCKTTLFLFPHFFPNFIKKKYFHGNIGGGNLMQTTLFFISLILSNFIKKKYFHGNMGTLGGRRWGTLHKQLSFLLPHFFPISYKIEIFPWEHGNIGDILQKNSGADSKHKIVILSEACTKVLHPPKVLFLVQELFFFFFTCFACGGVPPMKCIISHKKHNPEPVPDFY